MTRRRGAIARRAIPVAVQAPVQLVLGLPLGLDLPAREEREPSPVAPIVALRRAA